MERQKKARKARILSSVSLTIPGTIAVVSATWVLGLGQVEVAMNNAERVLYTFPWVLLAMLPYALVCMTILQRRLDEGAHNPVVDLPSEFLAICCRVMQNHLEQWIWFGACIVTLAIQLKTEEIHLIPILGDAG